MNYYKQKHNVLKILTYESYGLQIDENNMFLRGISIKDLLLKINISEIELNIIISELYENKEIKKGHDGLIIEKSGIASFTNKKYLKIYKSYVITNLKDIIQIIVPILTSIIAIIAISNSNHSTLEERLKKIEILLKSQKPNIIEQKKYPNTNHIKKP